MTDAITSCACGLTYNHLAWERLTLVGGMDAHDPIFPRKILELRNCNCGSTISVPHSASIPTKKSREAAVKLLNFEAKRQKMTRERQ